MGLEIYILVLSVFATPAYSSPINQTLTLTPLQSASPAKLPFQKFANIVPQWFSPISKPRIPPTSPKMVCQNTRLKTHLRILRGSEVRRDEDFIPWRVRIGTNPEGRESRDHCGGTIISPTLVLTAAHCVQPYSDFPFFIYYDTINPNDKRNTKFAQADYVTWHNLYVGNGELTSRVRFEHDIALLHFPRPLDFSGKAWPSCLPWSFEDFPSIHSYNDHRQGIVSGWGATRVDAASAQAYHQSCHLLKVGLSAMTTQECNGWYDDLYRKQPHSHPIRAQGKYPLMELTQGMFCARPLEKEPDPEFGIGGFCFGDSGGGFDWEMDGQVYTMGIISTLYLGICGHSFPNKLIKTTSYLPWIAAHAKCEGQDLRTYC